METKAQGTFFEYRDGKSIDTATLFNRRLAVSNQESKDDDSRPVPVWIAARHTKLGLWAFSDVDDPKGAREYDDEGFVQVHLMPLSEKYCRCRSTSGYIEVPRTCLGAPARSQQPQVYVRGHLQPCPSQPITCKMHELRYDRVEYSFDRIPRTELDSLFVLVGFNTVKKASIPSNHVYCTEKQCDREPPFLSQAAYDQHLVDLHFHEWCRKCKVKASITDATLCSESEVLCEECFSQISS